MILAVRNRLEHHENWVVSASASVKVAQRRAWRSSLARRAPAVVAVVLVLLGVIAVAVRLDAPSDGTVVSFYRVDGVVVDVPSPVDGPGLQTGDVVTQIAGHRLADGLGGLARPQAGEEIAYDIVRDGTAQVTVRVDRTDPYPLLVAGWGNLIFVFALAGLATALYLRRPEEPATTPLLIAAAGLLGSTLAFVAGIPALALATGGPVLWLYNLSIIGVYSVAWGAALAFAAAAAAGRPALRPGPAMLALAYAAPPVLMLVWMAVAAVFAPNGLRWFDLVYAGTTALVAATLVTGGVLGIVAYRRSRDPLTRSRLRWVAGGSVAAVVLGLAGWHLPELITGPPAAAVGRDRPVRAAVRARYRRRAAPAPAVRHRAAGQPVPGLRHPGRRPRGRVRGARRGAGQRASAVRNRRCRDRRGRRRPGPGAAAQRGPTDR